MIGQTIDLIALLVACFMLFKGLYHDFRGEKEMAMQCKVDAMLLIVIIMFNPKEVFA